MIPSQLTLAALQEFARDVYAKIGQFTTGNIDLRGRRIIGSGPAVDKFDCVTKYELEKAVSSVAVSQGRADPHTLLGNVTSVRFGAYATRGAAAAHPSQLFLASDRDYIGFVSNGAIWAYVFGIHRDAAASRPTPTSDEANYPYWATDTFVRSTWSGSGWVDEIAPAFVAFLGLTSSFPALKRSLAILQARLADDSAHTDIEVADEAYDATAWNGSLEVPTKNAIRDKFEAFAADLVSDEAYNSGTWNGVTAVAPSKNAVRDKVETLLSQNGVNFGPGAVASITVVNGQITAIS